MDTVFLAGRGVGFVARVTPWGDQVNSFVDGAENQYHDTMRNAALSMGLNPDSAEYGAGKATGEIASVAIPGGLALKAASKAAKAAKGVEKLVQEGIYVVRTEAGEVYVGQSGNITKRLAQHVDKGKFSQAEVDAAERVEVLGGKTAREVQEQLKLDSFGGKKAPGVLNKVNPIGDRRLSLLPDGYARP